MHTAGLIIAILGGLFLFGSALALSFVRPDERATTRGIFEVFILGGIISFCRNLCRGITLGMRDRSSEAYPPLIVLGVSIGLVIAGFILLAASGT